MQPTLHVLILSISAVHLATTQSAAFSNVTAVFAFGDSILDPGNNNGRLTVARANHPPYGMNFPSGIPSGRFSDGKLPTDIIVAELGIKPFLPAYLDPDRTDADLLTGVSFASAGSGLDEATTTVANVLTMEKQLEYFGEALETMRRAVGGEEVDRILREAVVMASWGNNDMLKNFYHLQFRMRSFTVGEYQDYLLNRMEGFIRSLQTMGARKVAVVGLPPLGCLPVQVTLDDVEHFRPIWRRNCVMEQNMESQAYNTKLQQLLTSLLPSLPVTAKLAYVDSYTTLMSMINTPSDYGFEKTLEGCCGEDLVAIGPLCNKLVPVCSNPSKYIFWDSAHPSQAAYTIFSQEFLKDVLPKLLQ